MVKLRDARYCNLKLLLIYLVIYGHLIEPGIWNFQTLMAQYRWIYLFHMPLFCFLSGLFLNNHKACGNQFRKMLSLYILLQTAAVLLGNGKVKPLTPYWHLWYLLSYIAWAGIGWIWFRFYKGNGKILILVISILVGCAAGFIPSIGRVHSLSRTLVFFPYFWAGLMCDHSFPWQRLKSFGLIALGIVFAVMLIGGNNISAVFLYQAAAYGPLKNGFGLRLICYLLGFLLCLFLLSFIPAKRFPFTRAGANTMPAYLLHAPIVLYLRELDIPWIFYLLITAMILYGVYKILQWHSKMYGIIPSRRREHQWLRFKRYTKNMPSQSTGSFCP